VTRVLGTAFDVTRYASDTTTRVAVASGKVSVTADARRGAAPHGALIVAAGGVGLVGDSTATLIAGERTADIADWVRGRLVFRQAPVEDVLATVTRWYGYEFRVADSTLTHERVTAVLVRSSTADALADALTTLKIVLGVDMRFDGRVITLVPKKHPRTERREPDAGASRISTLAAGA
jgi:ferric-dicitrate binding protein FerR (iron transport regulator)